MIKRRKLNMGKMLTLLILMSVFLVGCKEDVPANATVEDTLEVSDELLTENTEDSNTEGDVDKNNINEFTDSDSDTDVSTENPDEDTKVDNSESITKPDEEDTKDTSSETKEPEETTSSESSTTVVPPVVEEPVTPPVKEEPTTPPPVTSTVPSVSWDGGGITLGSLGITIPTLRDFNDEALTDNTNNTFWTGDNNDVATAQKMYDTLTSVRNAVINTGVIGEHAQGFAVEQYRISWSYTSYSSSNDIMLDRNPLDGTYTLTINTPLDSDIFGVHDVAPYSRDVLLTMCSIFSSQPQTVYSAVYDSIHGDDNLPIPLNSWGTVGDCKGYIDYESCYSGHFVFKFKAQ